MENLIEKLNEQEIDSNQVLDDDYVNDIYKDFKAK